MKKIWIFLTLFFAFATYSSWIYTGATDYGTVMTTRQQLGKKIYQEYNCQSCHQIFGLGGYLGPELTTAISDKTRGEAIDITKEAFQLFASNVTKTINQAEPIKNLSINF